MRTTYNWWPDSILVKPQMILINKIHCKQDDISAHLKVTHYEDFGVEYVRQHDYYYDLLVVVVAVDVQRIVDDVKRTMVHQLVNNQCAFVYKSKYENRPEKFTNAKIFFENETFYLVGKSVIDISIIIYPNHNCK